MFDPMQRHDQEWEVDFDAGFWRDYQTYYTHLTTHERPEHPAAERVAERLAFYSALTRHYERLGQTDTVYYGRATKLRSEESARWERLTEDARGAWQTAYKNRIIAVLTEVITDPALLERIGRALDE